MAAEGGSSASNMRSLDRAIDVLEVLDSSTQPLRLTEIARRAGLHIATTQRILGVLEARGRVEHDESGYRAGLALLFGAHAYLESSPLVRVARPVVQELADATGLTSSLFARSGTSRAVIVRVEGAAPMRYVLPTGERLPLTLGAGKVIAAHLDGDDLDAVIAAESHLRPATGERPTREALLEELAHVREAGFVSSRQGRAFGVASVASAILAGDGRCVAGIQVAGGIEELPEDRVAELSVAVRRAADVVARRLG